MRKAVRHLVTLRQGGGTINLWVNVSPRQLAGPSFLASQRQVRPMIGAVLDDSRLKTTENVLVDCTRRLQRVLRQIPDLGYKQAIDDVGAANSSLASLTRYPISCSKIDRSLIAHKDFRLLVTGVMTIARAIGARIVAEGVETDVQWHWLQDNQCDEFQGFSSSKPVPFAELQRLVAAGKWRTGHNFSAIDCGSRRLDFGQKSLGGGNAFGGDGVRHALQDQALGCNASLGQAGGSLVRQAGRHDGVCRTADQQGAGMGLRRKGAGESKASGEGHHLGHLPARHRVQGHDRALAEPDQDDAGGFGLGHARINQRIECGTRRLDPAGAVGLSDACD